MVRLRASNMDQWYGSIFKNRATLYIAAYQWDIVFTGTGPTLLFHRWYFVFFLHYSQFYCLLLHRSCACCHFCLLFHFRWFYQHFAIWLLDLMKGQHSFLHRIQQPLCLINVSGQSMWEAHCTRGITHSLPAIHLSVSELFSNPIKK